jgi:hypothetical protein
MGSLLHSARSWHRPRIRAAVGRGGSARSCRPRERGNADAELDRARLTERARFAEKLDIELRVACCTEAASRHELGSVARALLRGRAYRRLGFVRLSDYARERLGVSARTLHAAAWVATRLEALPIVAAAFDRSVDRRNAAAWLARAGTVTVRRLADEVSWVLEARDLFGTERPLDPPPLDSVLVSPVVQASATSVAAAASSAAIVQIGAHAPLQNLLTKFGTHRRAALEVCDVEIQCTAPVSVVAIFREAPDAFAEPSAPRWSALERVLRHVIADWEATPRHRDPIFARDGWRCTVPGCSSRRNLYDHHLHYRSRGGGNARENRIAVCASHHLHGIHAGAVRAWGTAPRDVHWQLGVRPGGPPLLSYVGDRRCPDEARSIPLPLDLTDDVERWKNAPGKEKETG